MLAQWIAENTAEFSRRARGIDSRCDDEELLFGKAAPPERPPPVAIAMAPPMGPSHEAHDVPLPQFGSASPPMGGMVVEDGAASAVPPVKAAPPPRPPAGPPSVPPQPTGAESPAQPSSTQYDLLDGDDTLGGALPPADPPAAAPLPTSAAAGATAPPAASVGAGGAQSAAKAAPAQPIGSPTDRKQHNATVLWRGIAMEAIGAAQTAHTAGVGLRKVLGEVASAERSLATAAAALAQSAEGLARERMAAESATDRLDAEAARLEMLVQVGCRAAD